MQDMKLGSAVTAAVTHADGTTASFPSVWHTGYAEFRLVYLHKVEVCKGTEEETLCLEVVEILCCCLRAFLTFKV